MNSVERDFLPTGYCRVNIKEVSRGVVSGMEFKRLFRDGAVKVWDTKITEDREHFKWYKRKALCEELVEPGDVILFGKRKSVTIKEKTNTLYKLRKLYWRVRIWLERITGN